MSQDKKKAPFCPHWSVLTQRCGVDEDGLYIPLETYVECYCNSSEYKGCQHLNGVESEESVVERIRNLHSAIIEGRQ